MADLGELSLWAAVSLALFATIASVAAGWTRRADLLPMGGRAADATVALLIVVAVGLGHALVTVQLKYYYVAELSSFVLAPGWRLAGLWSGPGGGGLALTILIAVGAALSWREGPSPRTAARTGCLAALAAAGVLAVIVRARLFAQSPTPALVGVGLPPPMREITWQLELWASYLTAASAAFAFAGVIGEQLVESAGDQRSERAAARLAAAMATLALLVGAWRAYAGTGRLLDATGAAYVIVHVPTWLVAIAYLHAPGGLSVPSWAVRWRRIVGSALFPSALGGTAALLGSGGGVPSPLLWAAGFAVGIVSGAMIGMAGRPPGIEWLRRVPGFGIHAFTGALVTLGFAAAAAVWWLLRGSASVDRGWLSLAFGVASLGALVVWSVSRPAGRWRWVWPLAAASALVAGGTAMARLGTRALSFELLIALAAAAVVGFLADLGRVIAARRLERRAAEAGERREARVLRLRSRRRRSSVLGHLGLASIIVGLSAGSLSRSETQPLSPGDSFSLESSGEGDATVTYLGLSRYEMGDVDKRVASFLLRRGGDEPELVTAAMTFDRSSQRQVRTPALARGLLGDLIVDIVGRRDDEGIMSRLTVRPLASLVWLGGGLLLISFLWPAGSVPRDLQHADGERI